MDEADDLIIGSGFGVTDPDESRDYSHGFRRGLTTIPNESELADEA